MYLSRNFMPQKTPLLDLQFAGRVRRSQIFLPSASGGIVMTVGGEDTDQG